MNPTAADEKPRLLWANVLMFVLTMAGAVIVVPWYGFTHGYSVAAWVWFAVFLYAQRACDHGRLSPSLVASDL